MLRITNIKVPIAKLASLKKEDQITAILAFLEARYQMKKDQILDVSIQKRSLDARKKQDIHYLYSVDVTLKKETVFLKKPNIMPTPIKRYETQKPGDAPLLYRPVIVGMGPAGLFCALELARLGYRPLVLERGAAVEERARQVEVFWEKNQLDPSSNVQFGEGGAGTFSDGKLNTLVKDTYMRNHRVLETFVSFGAPEEIQYHNKPHIGTDKLRVVIQNMRNEILSLGGEVRFHATVTDFVIHDNQIREVVVNETEHIPCTVLVLAIGHSARDTFTMLQKHNLSMEAKAFAIGVRIEHPQTRIGQSQYGDFYQKLPPADYKLTHALKNGRGIYSFCMCPGGFVVNASSEKGHLAVNGMSNHDRAERNANSALIVTVTPDDFDGGDCLSGIRFQRKWEALAFKEGQGNIPIQRYGDLKENQTTKNIGTIAPNSKGAVTFGNLRNCLPAYVADGIVEGVEAFGHIIKGFDDPDAILSGVETRTSSPVRIHREDGSLLSNQKGIYPCGEGAGYAGGIVSAAMDGIKVFEAIASKYAPL